VSILAIQLNHHLELDDKTTGCHVLISPPPPPSAQADAPRRTPSRRPQRDGDDPDSREEDQAYEQGTAMMGNTTVLLRSSIQLGKWDRALVLLQDVEAMNVSPQ